MAGTIVADQLEAASTSTLVIKNGVANTPPTIQDTNGTQIGTFCRAWVNFNGTTNTGGFCTIRGSFNVTSVADNGTGDYTVNITNALPDANYNVVGALGGSTVLTVDIGILAANAPTTTTLRFGSRRTTDGVLVDATYANISIFR
jgi:hypothetical protein